MIWRRLKFCNQFEMEQAAPPFRLLTLNIVSNTSNSPPSSSPMSISPKLNFIDSSSVSVTDNVSMVASEMIDEDEILSNRYSNRNHLFSQTQHSILPYLNDPKYAFSDVVKNRANSIYNKMRYQVRRKKTLRQLLFYCVYNSYLELGIDINPIELGKHFDLTQSEVQKTDSMFSPLQTGYRPPSTIITPSGYLPGYCEALKLSQDCTDAVLQLAKEIMDKDPSLHQENPQTVAAGILRYFTIMNGIQCDDPQRLAVITSRSNVTIDNIYRRISAVDNR